MARSPQFRIVVTGAEVRVLDRLDKEAAYELAIMTLLAHQVDAMSVLYCRHSPAAPLSASISCSTPSIRCAPKAPWVRSTARLACDKRR